MDQASLNLNWSAALLDGLVKSGVRHLVVSPGSRNTPLLLAGEQHPALEIYVQVDERSAAFLALGLAKATNRPVAIAGTSGSAVANWFPAIMEASHSGVPLILLSADRPWELQQCGANQTVDQHNLFGRFCRACYSPSAPGPDETNLRGIYQLARQACDRACGLDSGPVQINLPFREPLVTSETAVFKNREAVLPPERPVMQVSRQSAIQINELISANPGIILAGQDCGGPRAAEAICELAKQLAVPVLADPLSGMRWSQSTGSRVCTHYDLYLHREQFLQQEPRWILQFGRLPVSRRLQDYLVHHHAVPQLVVENRGHWEDPLGQAAEMIHGDTTHFCRQLIELNPQPAPNDWSDLFIQADRALEAKLEQGPGNMPPEGAVIRSLLACLPEGSLLFCGNSLGIRYLDAYSKGMDKYVRVEGNRGVSGIDGNVSTLMGLAAGSGKESKVVGLIGDLAFFHDLNGLAVSDQVDAVVVLFNNNGGGIFEHLPQAGLPAFERLWKTPTGLDFERAADLFRVNFERVHEADAFADSLQKSLNNRGVSVIEVMIDSTASKQSHLALLENA